MKKITKAVIPAAGLGTRMLPISKSVPKEMLPIVDLPAIFYLVDEAVKSGITDILIITGRDKDAMENFFDHSIEYFQQSWGVRKRLRHCEYTKQIVKFESHLQCKLVSPNHIIALLTRLSKNARENSHNSLLPYFTFLMTSSLQSAQLLSKY